VSARNRELLALIPVGLLVTAGFTAVFIVENQNLGNLSLIYGGYFLGICVAAHLFIRRTLPFADPYLFPLAALLAAFGLVMIYRIDDAFARDQANWFVLGVVLFVVTIRVLRDYEVLERYRYVIATVGIGLLILPRVPGIGSQTNGAFLAIKVGSLTFQPTELAKIAIVIFLASYLHERREVMIVGARRILGLTLPPLKHFGPLIVVWGVAMLMLIFIRDLGSSLMFFGAFLALLYVATSRLSFVLIGLAMFLAGASFFASTVPHVQDRIDIWTNTFDPRLYDRVGGSFQVAQSLFAQADGGLFGRGFGQALLALPGGSGTILPAPQTDLIYSVIVNELGLFGGAALIVIYALIVERGFKTAMLAGDGFSKLLATGLTAVFALQAFVIIGGVTRVIPLTGVTLPFVSYGGSSIVANFILLALLLLISNRARRPGAISNETGILNLAEVG
jgi:cell division protein FtsW (lipid II flippase)